MTDCLDCEHAEWSDDMFCVCCTAEYGDFIEVLTMGAECELKKND
jgi:hypothetical protein